VRLFAVALALAAALGSQANELVTRDVFLMGTRATLSAFAPSRTQGLQALQRALDVLENAEAELSTWREDSAISALNRQPVGIGRELPTNLCSMFAQVRHWYQETGGAFDPGVGPLTAAWGINTTAVVPSDEVLQHARAASGLKWFAFDPSTCMVRRAHADALLDVGAFGKGAALDRINAVMGASAWLIDLGGQVSVGGAAAPSGAWVIDIAHPLERDRPQLQVRLTSGSLSTSAGSERDQAVDGRRVGHILDPRTGTPAPFSGSVTVWHASGLAADALSTALFVMGSDEGTRWAEQRGIAALFLTPRGGSVELRATTAFRPLLSGRE
jgi:thiamine biosynthesis lipoprotein